MGVYVMIRNTMMKQKKTYVHNRSLRKIDDIGTRTISTVTLLTRHHRAPVVMLESGYWLCCGPGMVVYTRIICSQCFDRALPLGQRSHQYSRLMVVMV